MNFDDNITARRAGTLTETAQKLDNNRQRNGKTTLDNYGQLVRRSDCICETVAK